jgi:purine nucleoside permease
MVGNQLDTRQTIQNGSTGSSTTGVTYTHIKGTLAPNVLFIANAFEFSYLEGYNFSTAYNFSDSYMTQGTFNCTDDGETCMLAIGQELVSAMAITVLQLIPHLDLSKTYIIITGTGGVNPKYATAGGVTISRYSVQWEWGNMFLGDDLPANFSGQYFFAYGQDFPDIYPYVVGTEVYELNNALANRFYDLTSSLEYEEVEPALQEIRAKYEYAAARRSPFLARCDVVSAQVYWHGEVAGNNVEYYTNLVTNGTGKYCHTNEDDQGRIAALLLGAVHKKVDFGRIAMVKAFSNFDRPAPGTTAYQSRFLIGESATTPGLQNAWKTIKIIANDITANWGTVYKKGIEPDNYIGDGCAKLGGTPGKYTTIMISPKSSTDTL